MEINNYNFIIPIVSDKGEEIRVYVNQPLESELRGISRVLGKLFTLIKDKEIDLLIFLKDWDVMIDEWCEKLENGEVKKKAVYAFLDRCFLTAEAFTCEGDIIEKLSTDEEFMVKGALLFISALYRYSMKAMKDNEMGAFFTSLSITEFRNSLKPSVKASTKPGVIKRRK